MREEDLEDPAGEIRRIRERISAQLGDDPERLFQHYLTFQEQFRDRMLSSHNDARRKDDKSAA